LRIIGSAHKNMVDKMATNNIVVAGIIFHAGKVLILRRSIDEDIFPGMWELPSGKKKASENITDCLFREILEETGLMIKIIQLVSFFEYKITRDKRITESIQINYLAEPVNFKEVIKLSEEHQKFAWVGKREIKKYNLSAETRSVVSQAFAVVPKK